ncbi:hypothetical protein HDU96_004620 [Phlyctochytrium bullatum]|nr:hypothetical protein HDU96_004620 [Phlyctochytrium bullatum]
MKDKALLEKPHRPSQGFTGNIVTINNIPMPLNPTTGRPDVGPGVNIVNDRGVSVLGPLVPGESYKLVCAWDMGSLDWATAAALKLERKKWEEAQEKQEKQFALKMIGGQRMQKGALNLDGLEDVKEIPHDTKERRKYGIVMPLFEDTPRHYFVKYNTED